MDIDTKKLSDDELSVAIKVLEMADKHKIPFGEDQLQVAFKVAEEAKRQKINLDFVLPLVMQESRFKQNAVSPKGAIGVMQLMPDTATGYKVDPNDLAQNIRGGMLLIKDLASNKLVNNDPVKVLIGYNTKTKTRNKYYETEDPAVLPEETFDYVEKIVGYAGGDLPSVGGGEEGAAGEKSYTVPEVPTADAEAKSVISDEEGAPKESDTTISKPILATAGAQLGAGTAASIETAKQLRPIVKGLLAGRGQSPEVKAAQPATRYSMQRYLNSQLPENVKLTLSDLEKVTGGKKIRTMSEVQQALKAIQEVKVERTAKPVSVDPRTGMERKIYSTTPGRPAVDLSAYETKPSGPVKQALAREVTAGGELVKSVAPSAARIGLGTLGGASAAMSAYDANELNKKIESDRRQGIVHPTVKIGGIDTGYTEDELRLRSKLMSTAGGALSILPFGATQVGGLALSAPELIWSGYEMYKNRDQTPKPTAAPLSSRIQPAGNIPMADFSGLP